MLRIIDTVTGMISAPPTPRNARMAMTNSGLLAQKLIGCGVQVLRQIRQRDVEHRQIDRNDELAEQYHHESRP